MVGKHFCDTTQAWWHLHTHLFGKVVRVVCGHCGDTVGSIITCIHPITFPLLFTVSPHHPCICHLPFHSTLCLFNPTPVFGVCVWDCDVAFTLSLWLLMCLCCHLCPPFLGLMVFRFLHCLCAHAFLHCPGPHNNMAPFLCAFWCAPQGTPSISTERGKMDCGVVLLKK